jgi:hypothetical protein
MVKSERCTLFPDIAWQTLRTSTSSEWSTGNRGLGEPQQDGWVQIRSMIPEMKQDSEPLERLYRALPAPMSSRKQSPC